jgi:hypothetical protein
LTKTTIAFVIEKLEADLAEKGADTSGRIPPHVLARGVRELIAVLRRRYPGVYFIVRDLGEAAVAPEHVDVPDQPSAGAAATSTRSMKPRSTSRRSAGARSTQCRARARLARHRAR